MRTGLKRRASPTPSSRGALVAGAGVLAGIVIAFPAGASGEAVAPDGASPEGTVYYDGGGSAPAGAEQVSCDSAAQPDLYAEPVADDTVETKESVAPDGTAYDTFADDPVLGPYTADSSSEASTPDAAPAEEAAPADGYSENAAVCDAATAAAPLPAYARGFNTRQLVDWALTEQDGLVDRALNEMVRTRSRIHRLSVEWWDVEPAKGSFNWARYDRVVNAAAARGLQLILTPIGSPNWARDEGRRIPDDPNRKFRKFAYPDDLAAWNTFIRTLASHYGAKAYAYEIWNEENSRPFWDPATNTDPDPARYKDLFCRAATEIRAVRGVGALVGIGGLTARRATWNDSTGVREMRSSIYLNRAYNAGIAGCNPTFVGYHPYVFRSFCRPASDDPTMASTPGMRELGSVRDVMVNRGQSAKKIWMTEWSFPSVSFRLGSGTCRYTEARQASLIGREHNFIRTRPNVRYSIYFNYRDAPANPALDFNNSVGMARVNWSRKPSWYTWRALAQTPAP